MFSFSERRWRSSLIIGYNTTVRRKYKVFNFQEKGLSRQMCFSLEPGKYK